MLAELSHQCSVGYIRKPSQLGKAILRYTIRHYIYTCKVVAALSFSSRFVSWKQCCSFAFVRHKSELIFDTRSLKIELRSSYYYHLIQAGEFCIFSHTIQSVVIFNMLTNLMKQACGIDLNMWHHLNFCLSNIVIIS